MTEYQLLGALPDAALLVDASGRIAAANPAAERVFGSLTGAAIEQLLVEPERARFAAARATVTAANGTSAAPSTAQWQAQGRNGQEFTADVTLSAVMGAGYALVLVRDISERQRLERALRDSNRLKSEFFGHMSHELRTPLNGIIGFAEFLLEGKTGQLKPEQQEYLADILASGQRLLTLIDGVMELSRLETGTAEMHTESFALSAAIEEACVQVAAAAQEKGLGLRRSIEAGLHEVALDRRRLLQVLHYLLASAIKFSGEGRDIHVEATRQGDAALRLKIWDSGTVKRSAELEQLLSDYPQLDSSAIRRFGGSGLDLVLAKKIVEAQSGFFAIENLPGQGPAFSLILPLAPAPTDVAGAPAPARAASG
ncbi:MAG: histidine kinase dimerization/phospho-acceptor domain-containing protein [Steroidobacteraceae bacterium]